MQHATYPSLANKRVVITGGGTGIGVAIVEAFARQGAHVTFLDIARDASLALQEKLAQLPQPPVFRYCDLTDLDALAATFADIGNTSGATDILITMRPTTTAISCRTSRPPTGTNASPSTCVTSISAPRPWRRPCVARAAA